MLGKQVAEERLEQGCGVAVGEFVGAESEDLVARQLHSAVFGHHLAVADRIGGAAGIGVVLASINLQHDPATAGHEQEEVHPLPLKLARPVTELPFGVRVVVQVHLRNEGRQVEAAWVAVELAVGAEHGLLHRVVAGS